MVSQKQNKSSPDKHSELPGPDQKRTTRWLTLICFFIYILVAVSAFLPELQLWGINHLAFYSLPVRTILLILIGLTFFPRLAKQLYSDLFKLSHKLKHGGSGVDSVMTILAVASVVVFAGLKTSTNLFGDGQLIAQSFDAAWDGNKIVIMRSVEAIILEERISPGATLIYYGMAKVLTGLFDKGPVWGIRYTNCLLGAFYVYIMLGLLRRGPFSTEIRLWLMVLAFFTATIQLFFGYVENYTPLVFAGFVYILSAFLVLHGRSRLWVPVAVFVLASYIHVQALLFLPSLVYLVMWSGMLKKRKWVEQYAGPALTVLTVLGAVVFGFTAAGQFYLPLRGDELSYGLFSVVHLLDILNEILILMPVLPFFVVMAWRSRSRDRSGAETTVKTAKSTAATTGWFAKKAEWQFIFVLLIPCFVYLFLFKPEIGMARDWDLFSMTSLGLVPLALLIINRFFRLTKNHTDAGVFSSPAIVLTVVLALAWVGINASPSRSTARFERILEYDKTHASYAYENLAIFYYVNKNLDKATEMIEIACDISHNPRQYVRLAMYYDELERFDEALDLMRTTVAKHPEYEKSRIYYVSQLEQRQLVDEVLEASLEGVKYHPSNGMFWWYIGEVSLLKGDIETGVAAHQRAIASDIPDQARSRSMEQIKIFSPQLPK